MNLSKRQRRLAAKRVLVERSSKFKQIGLDERPYVPPGITRTYANNKYIVMVFDDVQTTKGTAIQVLIQNNTDTPM